MFEESPGLMPSREWKRATRRQAWFPGETLILGIGQGYMQATPLQLAQATALVANKGIWNRPHLAKTIEGEKPLDENPIPDIVLRDASDWTKVNHGMQHDVGDRVFIHRLFAFDGLGQVRTVPDAFVGHQRRGLGQLQHRRPACISTSRCWMQSPPRASRTPM